MAETVPLEEARALVLSNVGVLGTETVGLLDAVGRVLAAPVASDIDVCPFAASLMDGFALHAQDLAVARDGAPVVLGVVARVAAGQFLSGTVAPGCCVRIMTGAPVPAGLDAVVRFEDADVRDGDGLAGGKVAFTAPVGASTNIRPAGEEAQAGEVLARLGDTVVRDDIGLLTSCGAIAVPVFRRPRVAVIPIGSELVEPSLVPGPGQIRNSNGLMLAACVQAAGGVPAVWPVVADAREALADAVREAVQAADFVVTSGGAGGGDFDFIKQVLGAIGDLLLTSIAMRPGGSLAFGLVAGVPVFGLSGNPGAAGVGFEMVVRPALRKAQGHSCFERPSVQARLASAVKRHGTDLMFLHCALEKEEDGGYLATPAAGQRLWPQMAPRRASCLAVLPAGHMGPYAAGDTVECLLLDLDEEMSF